MSDAASLSLPPQDTSRLRELLHRTATGLSDDAVAEAISVGPEAAGALAASLIDSACRTGSELPAAVRCVWLAGELRLELAVPAIVRCVERLPGDHPLRQAGAAALSAIGAAAAEPLIAALERAYDPDARSRLADALSGLNVVDDRIRAALVHALSADPEHAAKLLAWRGEWRAVPDLLRTFDRLAAEPIADCPLCEGLQLSAIESAVRVLGGELSASQRATLDDVHERGDPMWTPGPDPFEMRVAPAPPRFRTAAARGDRPGRNDPCPCGSGKKYKRCHLEEDRRSAGH